MKNTIWVGRNESGNYYTGSEKLVVRNGRVEGENDIEDWNWIADYVTNFLNISLGKNEVAQLIYDTETQTFTVKREREKGWYLVNVGDGIFTAMHWNGRTFCKNPSEDFKERYEDGLIIDETPLTSPFLKEMGNV